jgi:hypothetical protein
LAWFLFVTAAITGYWVMQPVIHDPLESDLTLVYIGARIGLEHGWSHIYSLALQHEYFTQLRPGGVFNDGQRFLSPPPLAWLTLPLSLLGAAGTFYVWLAISFIALGAAWWLAAPSSGWARPLWLIGALAWYPVLYGLSLGQPILLVLLAMAACWKLSDSGKPYLAGVVLAASAIKPQLTLIVPAVLLVSGRWRIAAGWAMTTAVLAGASIAMMGGEGLRDYQSLLAEARGVVNNRFFTLAFFTGAGWLSSLVQGAVIVVGLVAAYLNRSSSTGRLIALGLVTTALSASYWHLQDYTILLAAIWLFWRDERQLLQRWWLLAVVVTLELAWPLSPGPALAAIAAWWVMLCIPWQVREPTPMAAAI